MTGQAKARPDSGRTLSGTLAAAGLVLFCAGCLCRLSIPGADTSVQTRIEAPLPGNAPHLCLVRPVTPRTPAVLILYATGDGGWIGTSKAVFRHLAERGYPVAGISAPDYLKGIGPRGAFVTPERLAQDLASIVETAKRELQFPAATPTILVGMSTGASFMVVAAAQPVFRPRPAGVVALSLARETDYVRHRRTRRRMGAATEASTMEDGRILNYTRLKSAYDLPIAVIQSKHDRYLPAARARELFGPDTATRRIRDVQARSHSFGGARDAAFRELDDALAWIESLLPRDEPAAAP